MRRAGVALAIAAGAALAAAAPPHARPHPHSRAALWPTFERLVAGFPIADDSGHAFTFPLLGGFEHPRPQLADIDGDGDLDLFVQEYPGRLIYFERTGPDGISPASYTWRSDRWLGLDVGEWSRLVDADGDGDLDLFAESPYSYMRWYRNDGGKRAARMVVVADSVRDVNGAPIFADRQNIAQFADLDCNGKLDMMLGRVDGTVARYEMASLDSAGPRFRHLIDRFEGIQIIGGDANQNGPPGPTLHGANTMALVDVDGDGDRDILWGDFFEPGILWIRNNGSCAAPSMRETPIPFPPGSPLRTSGYNAPAVADLDGDGRLDLLVGVIGGAYDPSTTSTANLYLMTQPAPGQWTIRTRRFLDMLDVGSESSPALGDIDGDGDLDLVIGNKTEPGAAGTASLYFLRNTGTAKAPAFRQSGTLPVAPGYHYAPALADLDGDGKLDLILGTWRDAVQYYRNDGTASAPHFALADSALVKITRGSHTTPALADLDGDGDLDLVVGESSGTLNYYRNDGTRTAPRFTLVSDEWLGVKAGARAVPRLVDLDGDRLLDLVIGTQAGPPLVYRNTGTKTQPAFAAETATVDWPQFSAPAFGDLDGDGRVDLLVGNAGGGLVYFHQLR